MRLIVSPPAPLAPASLYTFSVLRWPHPPSIISQISLSSSSSAAAAFNFTAIIWADQTGATFCPHHWIIGIQIYFSISFKFHSECFTVNDILQLRS